MSLNERATSKTSVNEILRKSNLNQLQLYLYGHPLIIYLDNRNILILTIKYIKETRRFSTRSFPSLPTHFSLYVFLLTFCFAPYVCVSSFITILFLLSTCCKFLGFASVLAHFYCSCPGKFLF